MDSLTRIEHCGVIPVVVMEDSDYAVSAAKAMLAGDVDVVEITLRSQAAMESIRRVVEACPEMLVGAGTVLNLEQCKQAMEAGAKFIVSPGFDREVAKYCIQNNILIIPGCVTPSEITEAVNLGIKVIKYFPSDMYGGLRAIKSLAQPFSMVRFIPTGGISQDNLEQYVREPYVFAVGGSWLCSKQDVAGANFEKISLECREARKTVLGYELAHVGINTKDNSASLAVCRRFEQAFGMETKEGATSNFAGAGIEVMNTMYLGASGHLAVRTNKISSAIADLEKKGFAVDRTTEKYNGDRMIAVYLKEEIGGFAVHLLQK